MASMQLTASLYISISCSLVSALARSTSSQSNDKQLMFHHKLYHVVIYEALLPLVCVQQRLFADPVDHSRDAGGGSVDLIQGLVCEQLLGALGVVQLAQQAVVEPPGSQLGIQKIQHNVLSLGSSSQNPVKLTFIGQLHTTS